MKSLHVYVNGNLTVIESNLEFAIPFWEKQARLRPDVKFRWEVV